MAQQNIDFGTFPDDPNADAIRTAFRKVQENFTEVYAGLEAQGVSSVNRTPGAGISVNSPVGNVIVTANIACVQVHTSTLSIGRDANGLQDTSITSSSQVLYVDLPASITGVTNITVSGYLSAVGNVIGGNINAGSGIISTTGNANVGNLNVTGNATVAGNISTGNISISGSFSITGNANVGNLGTTGLITATGNITGGNIVTPNVVSATGNITGGNISTAGNLGVTHTATVGNLTVTGNLQAGDIGVNSISYGNSLIDISNPGGNITMHVNGVPDIIVVTDTGMNLAGYLNATGNANVANLGTAGLITATGSISGGTLTTVGDANVGNLFTTGLISATGNITGGNLVTSGVLSVTGNANVGNLGTANITATGNVGFSGANVNLGSVGNLHISGGTAATVLTTDGAGNLSFTSFSGSPPGGPNGAVQYNSSTAYAGEAGFEYNDTTNTLSVDNISLIGTGNLTSGNLVSANYLTGTLTTGAQPNITSVGTLSSLSVSGNANIGNIGTAGLITATGNIDGGNINSPGRLSVTGNVVAGAVTYINNDGVGGQVLTTYGNGVTYWSAGTGGTSSSIVNGTSNVNIATSGGNITSGVGGTANVLVLTSTGANVNGTLSVSGNANVGNLKSDGILSATGNAQAGNLVTNGALTVSGNANIGNIGTSGLLTVTGNANIGNVGTTQLLASANVTAPQLISNIATGSPPLIVLSTTQVANLNVANAGHASTANTVVDAVQSNITAVGTLVSLSVSGNANIGNIGTAGLITATGNITGGNLITTGLANVGSLSVSGTSNLGPIGNVTITGGSSGQYLQTNGSGVLSWETVALSIISNGNSNVSIPAANGNVTISAIGNANIVVVTGTGANVNGTLSVSGNANIGNIGTAGLITATGNITGGNLITAGIITAIGNANVGNLGTAQVLATANVTAPQLISNIATGTAPLVVTSTTRVANLNVNHANVSDFSNVTTQTTGTFYPTFVSASTTANYALGSNANLSFNAATGNLSATILHATGGIVGGSFSTTGNITGANLISTKYIINSVQTGISAAGTTQGAATALGNTINIVSTVTNGANGVVLPAAIAGMTIYITNTSANALNVFPAASASINTGAANASLSQAAGATLHYIASSSTQWYTVGATYA